MDYNHIMATHVLDGFSREELESSLKTIASVISKIEKAKMHFKPKTPQHTVAVNRLKAFRIASVFIEKALKTGTNQPSTST
jgi:hypothetical protein